MLQPGAASRGILSSWIKPLSRGAPVLAVGALASMTAVAGCAGDSRPIVQGQPEILVSVNARITALHAAPDGTLFATSPSALWRAERDDPARWSVAAELPFHTIALQPASEGAVYFLPQIGTSIWSWTEGSGLRELRTQLTDSVIRDGHHVYGVPLMDLAANRRGEVIAVGDMAAIVRVAQPEGLLEANPMDPIARLPGTASYRSAFWRIDAYADRFYAATNQDLLVRENGTWRHLDFPKEFPQLEQVGALAATQGGVVVSFNGRGGEVMLLSHDGRRWTDLTPKAGALKRPLVNGASQPDGSVLLWSLARYVVEVRGTSVRVHDVPSLGAIRGAARAGRHIYVGGTQNGRSGVVVRVTR